MKEVDAFSGTADLTETSLICSGRKVVDKNSSHSLLKLKNKVYCQAMSRVTSGSETFSSAPWGLLVKCWPHSDWRNNSPWFDAAWQCYFWEQKGNYSQLQENNPGNRVSRSVVLEVNVGENEIEEIKQEECQLGVQAGLNSQSAIFSG